MNIHLILFIQNNFWYFITIVLFLFQKNSEFGKFIWQEVCDLYNSRTSNPKTIKEICDIYEIIKSEAKLNRKAEKINSKSIFSKILSLIININIYN